MLNKCYLCGAFLLREKNLATCATKTLRNMTQKKKEIVPYFWFIHRFE